MTKIRNITRYGSDRGSSYTFKGWRLCITRQKERFVRYFSDLEYGDADRSLDAAMAMRSEILAELGKAVEPPAAIFSRHRKDYV